MYKILLKITKEEIIMQRLISDKFSKQILCILILFVIIYTMFGFSNNTINKSYAATYTYTSKTNKLQKILTLNIQGIEHLYKNLQKHIQTGHLNYMKQA